ncbi:uncharacterized protein LOC143065268 [Mytilus galloprovincialis]|uniref:uncharacterized protein LOC143065268 n=1 Tax=Mytilus galloprovincialis TaxID=29158 RepID=UPI003F7B8455
MDVYAKILSIVFLGIVNIRAQSVETSHSGLTSFQQLDRTVVDSVLKIVDDKFDSLSERISSLERSVNGLQYYNVRQFKIVNSNLNSVNKVLQAMNSQVGLMDVENKGVKISVDLMKQDLKAVEKTNNLMFDAMEQNFNYLNKGFTEKLESLQSMVSVINRSSDEIAQKMQDGLPRNIIQEVREPNCSNILEKFEEKVDIVMNNTLSSLKYMQDESTNKKTLQVMNGLTETLKSLNDDVKRTMSYYYHTGDLVERIVGATETVAEDQTSIRDDLREFLEKQTNITNCSHQYKAVPTSTNPPTVFNHRLSEQVSKCEIPVHAITEFKQVLKNGSQLVELVTDLAQTSQISLKTTVVELLKEVHRLKESQKTDTNHQSPPTVNGFIEYDFELLLNATKGVLQMIEAVASNTRWIPYIFHNLQFVEVQVNHTLANSVNIQGVLDGLGDFKGSGNSGMEKFVAVENFTRMFNYIYQSATKLERLTPPLTRLLGEPEPFIVLNGGARDNEGRVEIYKKGKWGTLCGRFGHIEAAYICRHLGYMGGNSAGNGHFGSGSGMFWKMNVSCLYTRQCDIVNPIIHSEHCDHKQDFAVICDHMVRLRVDDESNSRNTGYLEIHHMDQWSRVCSTNWSAENSRVVCRQLGYEDGVLSSPSDEHVLTTEVVAVMNKVNCTGTEIRLDECKYGGWSPNLCPSKSFVHLTCS